MRVISRSPWQLRSEFRSADGAASIASHYQGSERPHAFSTILAEGLVVLSREQGHDLVDAPILISGMASSSIGWSELPYATLPLSLDGAALLWREMSPVASPVGEHRVLLISGVRSPIDIMRGEETELVGLFSLPTMSACAENSIVIKPGTHSKHLRIHEGMLVGFQTFMTGELFAVLGNASVLKHSVGELDDDWASLDPHEFWEGVAYARQNPLISALFRVRTRDVLDGIPAASNRAFLSGLLVGAELAGLANAPEQTPVVLAATEPLATSYRLALTQLELEPRLTVIPADEVELLSARGQARLVEHALSAVT